MLSKNIRHLRNARTGITTGNSIGKMTGSSAERQSSAPGRDVMFADRTWGPRGAPPVVLRPLTVTEAVKEAAEDAALSGQRGADDSSSARWRAIG
jgi:hypothetical protein